MALHFLRNKRRRAPSVIIVSLIDVLLVVLIFLMVTTTFKQNLPSLKLALPKSETAKPGASSSASKPFFITVATNFPHLFVESHPVTVDDLRRRLEEAVKRDSQLKVEIKADKAAPWGEVVKAIDTAKLANVGSINAVTERVAATGRR